MDTLVEAFLDSPALPRQLERLNQVWAEEQARRQRFYDEITEEGTWEFINGEVIMHSPAKYRHVDVADNLLLLLKPYIRRTGLGFVGSEKIMVRLTRNDYEPDVSFFRREVAAAFTHDQMLFPAPDFVAEVLSPSTTRRDRGVKFRDYAAHGVSEYWLIDPVAETVEQHGLRGEDYHLVGTWREEDEITSLAVTGFRIPAAALFDAEANLAALTRLLAPPTA